MTSFATSQPPTVCSWHQCRPNCICDVRFDDQCAKDYGNYGWKPAEESEYLYSFMRPDSEIGQYEIKPAGMRNGISNTVGFGEGMASILEINSDKFFGEVYFEVHPDRFKNNNDIKVEIYAGSAVPRMDGCAESGVLLAAGTSEMFSSTVTMFDDYNKKFENKQIECHPRASNAVMGKAEFTLNNPYIENSQAQIGDIYLYCIRVALNNAPGQKEVDADPSEDFSFIDTKFEFTGQLDDSVKEFRKGVRIFSNKPINSKAAYVETQNVKVKAFLCNTDATMSQGNLITYTVGQTVSICVGPTDDYVEGFEVTGFKNVQCANEGQKRDLVVGGETDFLTDVVKSPTYTNVVTGTPVTSAGIMAIQTKVTTGLIQLGDQNMQCSGEALVSPKSNRKRRDLQNAGGESVTLEREELGGVVVDFTISVGLTKPTGLPEAMSSGSKPSPHRRWILGISLLTVVVGLL